MIGIFMSFVKNWVWLCYIVVESLVLTLAFNYLAPKVNEIYLTTWKLPFVHVTYWHVFAFFIVIHYLGEFIQTLTPKIVSVNTTNNNKKNE